MVTILLVLLMVAVALICYRLAYQRGHCEGFITGRERWYGIPILSCPKSFKDGKTITGTIIWLDWQALQVIYLFPSDPNEEIRVYITYFNPEKQNPQLGGKITFSMEGGITFQPPPGEPLPE